jgi:hypothetical protein
MRRIPSFLRWSVVAGAALCAVSNARADVPTYSSFELQARTDFLTAFNLPPGSSFNSGTPTINDDAVVAFRLIVVGTTGNAGLWVGSGGVGSVVYDAPTGPLLSDPSINAAGKVAFEQADFGLSDGVYVYDPVSETTQLTIAPGGIFGIDSFGGPIINGSDVIGFRADQGATNAYFFDDGVTQTPVAFEGGGGVGFLFVPQFNDASQFAAKVRLGGTANSLPDQIRRYEPNGTFTILAEDDDSNPASPFTGFSNGVGFAEDGRVAFTAQFSGGEGVYVSDGATITEIASTNDAEVSAIDFFRPVLNGSGVVAFRAFDASGLRVIYAGDGATLRRVVGEHDLVPTDLGTGRIDQHDSSPVFGGSVGINESGDVVFAATLTPPGNNQIEWGTGVFVAYADAVVAAPHESGNDLAIAPPSPNPYTAATREVYALPRAGTVRVEVYDVRGRRVRVLEDGPRATGTHAVVWDGNGDDGSPAAAGAYFIRLRTERDEVVRRVVRLRR